VVYHDNIELNFLALQSKAHLILQSVRYIGVVGPSRSAPTAAPTALNRKTRHDKFVLIASGKSGLVPDHRQRSIDRGYAGL
jgi:hypothetical protein